MGLRLSLSPLFSAAQARAADAFTIEQLGVPGLVLMEHAGRAVADEVQRVQQKSAKNARVLVVCGKGNNGGDGLVAARHLGGRGVPVDVLLQEEPATGDCAKCLAMLRSCIEKRGMPVFFHAEPEKLWSTAAAPFSVVVDALFGTGLTRSLEGDHAALVGLIGGLRSRGAQIVSVDIASGWPTDGQAPGAVAVQADVTVTFGGRKIAHLSEPGAAAAGVVVEADIGLLHPPDEKVSVFALDGVELPQPEPLAHKGSYGHVGVVEGAAGMRGASHLSARAALRAGAGLVSLIGKGEGRAAEVMARGWDDVSRVDVLVVGPGLDAEDKSVRQQVTMARELGVRIVADAGALALLEKGDAECWTPHPGEAARLLGVDTRAVQQDRLAAARGLVEKLGGVVVLKGAQPIVATASRCVIVDGRAPALAVAGSGDVLAGILGASLAGAFGPATIFDAVLAGVWVHQQAGRRCARGTFAAELADAAAVVVRA